VGVEQFDQLGEVGERSGEPVDLINDYDVDTTSGDVIEQLAERWALHRAAGEAAIVVVVAHQLPAFMGLAFDVGLGRFALIVERVELLLEPAVGGDARVDRASKLGFAVLRFHGFAPAIRIRLGAESGGDDARLPIEELLPFALRPKNR